VESASGKWYGRKDADGKKMQDIHGWIQGKGGDRRYQGPEDTGAAGNAISGSSEPGFGVEEAIAPERSGHLFGEQEQVRQDRGGADRSPLRRDRPTQDGCEVARKKG